MAFSAEDIVPDSPTNNFATINSLDTNSTLSEGNLGVETFGNNYYAICNFPITEGKWYYEFAFHSGDPAQVFFPEEGYTSNNTDNIGADFNIWFEGSMTVTGYASGNINVSLYGVGNWTTPAEDTEYNAGTNWKYEVAGIYIDHTGSDIIMYLYRNGVLRRRIRVGSALTFSRYYFGYKFKSTWPSSTQYYNFGQDPYLGGKGTAGGSYQDSAGYGQFNYKPVDENGNDLEFYSLCTANLPDFTPTVIDDTPQDYFKAKIWTGDGTGTSRTISDVGFAADLIWTKKRSAGGAGDAWHQIYDTVRGYNSSLNSNTTNSESTSFDNSDNHGYLDLFTSDGFRFTNGSDASWPRHYYNESGETYVAWCWKAGGAPTGGFTGTEAMVNGVETTCSALATSAGASITPTVMSVNTDAGFSIVKMTTSNVEANDMSESFPHGLSKTPEFIIGKEVSGSDHWVVYHKNSNNGSAPTNLQGMALHNTGSTYTNSGYRTYEVTSSLIKIGRQLVEHNNQDAIFYCWHSVEGYSKFGSYTGKSQSPFNYVHVGFRPALIIIKAIDDNGYNSYQGWSIFDTARNEHNPANTPLYANASYVEGVDGAGGGGVGGIDILSNGFRILDGSASYSGIDGIRHIYMAFAEQPFKYSNAR